MTTLEPVEIEQTKKFATPSYLQDAPTAKRSAVAPDVSNTFAIDLAYVRLTLWLNTKSNGHGDELMRIISFLVIGGSAAVVNLVGLAILNATIGHVAPFWVCSTLATEVSVIYNFTLNDRFTFRSLGANHHTWLMRCLRFHGPALIGTFLTVSISSTFHYRFHLRELFAQAGAIAIVTVVNFIMHRFWTFRPHNSPATAH